MGKNARALAAIIPTIPDIGSVLKPCVTFSPASEEAAGKPAAPSLWDSNQRFADQAPRRLAISPATYPAPNPSSMFTTDTPGQQLLSMASKAATPPKLAP